MIDLTTSVWQPWISEKIGGISGYMVRVRAPSIDRGETKAYYAEFEVIEQMGALLTGEPLYSSVGAVSSMEHTEDIDAAEVCFHGSVKWDGCSNVATNSACMLHLCGPEAWAEFAMAMAAIQPLALRAMGRTEFGS